MPRTRVFLLAAALVLAACSGDDGGETSQQDGGGQVEASGSGSGSGSEGSTTAAPTTAPPTTPPPPPPPELPQGGRTIFPQHRVVAYYGTGGTDALGVLGEGTPEQMIPKLQKAAAPFATPDRKVQLAFEMIVTVADGKPGDDGSYSHDIDTAQIDKYLAAARQAKALLILDLQPGRSDFLTVAKRYERYLREPEVGLALDSEWRMAPNEVPGKVIGQVGAAEVNEVSAYLAKIVVDGNLPEKIFMLHTFEQGMLLDIDAIEQRPGLALVQHLDGFGARQAKLSKYETLKRPDKFHLGFKLFYDEDINIFSPAEALTLVSPAPEFFSYQ